MEINQIVKHPEHKKPVKITQFDGDYVAFTVTCPIGSGQYRMWAHKRTFIEESK